MKPRPKGKDSPHWRGGQYIQSFGYVCIYAPNHPSGKSSKYVLEHILIAEEVLGHRLPKGSCVHHINGDTSDNRHKNLIICDNIKYHHLLHCRASALRESGNPNYRKCSFCGEWDNPDNNMYVSPNNHRRAWHRECKNKYARDQRLIQKLGCKPENLESEAMSETF